MLKALKASLRSDVVATVAVVVVTTALGVGVAFAAMGGVGGDTDDLSLRTLAPGVGISLTHAFGAHDEDCLYATQPTMLPDGQLHPMRQLVCYH